MTSAFGKLTKLGLGGSRPVWELSVLDDITVCFLSGGLQRSPIERATGLALFGIPVARHCCLLDAWSLVIDRALCRAGFRGRICWNLLVSADCEFGDSVGDFNVRVIRESREHRGTAGAVCDSCDLMAADSGPILLVELSASPAVQLGPMFEAWDLLRRSPAACVLGQSNLGRYCGVALGHRALFDLVPDTGFFDFKEQLLPLLRLAGGGVSSVVIADRARRVWSRSDWLDVVLLWDEFAAGSVSRESQRGRPPEKLPLGSLIVPGAVTAGATVVKSIVLQGAVLQPGALVARSVIGPGMRVPADARVIDSWVADPLVGRAGLLGRASGTNALEVD